MFFNINLVSKDNDIVLVDAINHAMDEELQLNEKLNDPISMYLTDLYTVSVNLAGLPAISVPSGFINKLPVGMQLIGNYFQESLLMNVAHQYQKVTDWHQKIPQAYE